MDDSLPSHSINNLKSNNNTTTSQNLKSEKRILRVSLIGSIAFLLLELGAAFFTHSQAILMDCVYDLVDLCMLIPFMALVPKLYKPVSEKWPYGFAQIESLFVIIKYGLLLILDMLLLINNVKLILAGGHTVNAGAVAGFELFVSVSCIGVFFLLRHMKKKFSSPTVSAELYIWKIDAYSTGGVGLAFIASLFIQHTSLAWIVPYVDPAIAVFLAVILAKEPITMIYESVRNLILAAPDEDTMENIRETASSSLDDYDFVIDFLDVVKTGRKMWVDIYITPNRDLISVSSMRQARDDIIGKLKSEYDDIFVELIPEIEND